MKIYLKKAYLDKEKYRFYFGYHVGFESKITHFFDDIFNDVLLNFLEKKKEFNSYLEFMNYMKRSLINHTIDSNRGDNLNYGYNFSRATVEFVEADHDYNEMKKLGEYEGIVLSNFNKMMDDPVVVKTKAFEPLYLRFVEDKSYVEISKELKLTESCVKLQVRRFIEKNRNKLLCRNNHYINLLNLNDND